eukprot:412782_1
MLLRVGKRCWRVGFGLNQYTIQMRSCTMRIGGSGTAGFSHVGLAVVSLTDTYDNFFNKLGWEEIGGDESYPAKFISDGVSILTLWQIPNTKPVPFHRRENVGLHHIALRVESKETLFDLYERVKDINGTSIEFEPEEVKGFGWWHFMCYEPGGIRVEFTYHGTPVTENNN